MPGSIAVALLLLQNAAIQDDDDRVLREARRAQAQFETVRRAHLPLEHASGTSRCDAHIGRFCYWYDSTQRAPAPEPARITAARNALLGVLDAAAAATTHNAWITGQRVRYLLEGGRAGDARAAARACRAEQWQCLAFEGLALHVAERYQDADSVYAAALAAMPREQRCEWLDLRRLVDGPLGRELSRADCDGRMRLGHRLLDLSQPLWSVSGNDLRTEHLARMTMAGILAQSANAHGMSWSGDSRELLLRYGWSEWYTRSMADPIGAHGEPRVTGHDREPSYRFFPDIESIVAPVSVAPESWPLRDPLARTRYAPRHLKRLSALPHQLARFPRGDSMLIAVAFAVSDTALARDTVAAWLVTRPASLDGPPAVRATAARGAIAGLVPAERLVASIEVRGTATGRAARARYGVEPLPCRDGWCLSDLLLYAPMRDAREPDLSAALAGAATAMTFSRREPLGVLWEVQGATPGPSIVWFGLTVTPVRANPVRRIVSRLKLAPELSPVRIRWQATLASANELYHVELRLPESARGRYRMLLTVEAPGGPTLTSSREVEVRP